MIYDLTCLWTMNLFIYLIFLGSYVCKNWLYHFQFFVVLFLGSFVGLMWLYTKNLQGLINQFNTLFVTLNRYWFLTVFLAINLVNRNRFDRFLIILRFQINGRQWKLLTYEISTFYDVIFKLWLCILAIS
jgi:hypothetical protein